MCMKEKIEFAKSRYSELLWCSKLTGCFARCGKNGKTGLNGECYTNFGFNGQIAYRHARDGG